MANRSKRDAFTLSPLAKHKLQEIEELLPDKSRSDIVSEAIIYYSTLFERKATDASIPVVDKTVATTDS